MAAMCAVLTSYVEVSHREASSSLTPHTTVECRRGLTSPSFKPLTPDTAVERVRAKSHTSKPEALWHQQAWSSLTPQITVEYWSRGITSWASLKLWHVQTQTSKADVSHQQASNYDTCSVCNRRTLTFHISIASFKLWHLQTQLPSNADLSHQQVSNYNTCRHNRRTLTFHINTDLSHYNCKLQTMTPADTTGEHWPLTSALQASNYDICRHNRRTLKLWHLQTQPSNIQTMTPADTTVERWRLTSTLQDSNSLAPDTTIERWRNPAHKGLKGALF